MVSIKEKVVTKMKITKCKCDQCDTEVLETNSIQYISRGGFILNESSFIENPNVLAELDFCSVECVKIFINNVIEQMLNK